MTDSNTINVVMQQNWKEEDREVDGKDKRESGEYTSYSMTLQCADTLFDHTDQWGFCIQ